MKNVAIAVQQKRNGVKFLKIIRDLKGLRRDGMATSLGLKPQVYDYYEQKSRSIPMDLLIKVWEFSGLSAEDFLNLIKNEYGAGFAEEAKPKMKRKKE